MTIQKTSSSKSHFPQKQLARWWKWWTLVVGAVILCLFSTSLLTCRSSQMPDSPLATLTSSDAATISFFISQVKEFRLLPEHVDLFHELMGFHLSACSSANITTFLYAGSLIGLERSGTIIPWDDDVDFVIPYDMKDVYRNTVKSLYNNTILFLDYAEDPSTLELRENNFKFSSSLVNHSVQYLNGRLNSRPFNWPFVDVYFYKDIGDTGVEISGPLVYVKEDIFPLKTAVFWGKEVPVANKVTNVIKNMYGDDVIEMCESNIYQRSTSKFMGEVKKISCSKLEPFIPGLLKPDPNKMEKEANESRQL